MRLYENGGFMTKLENALAKKAELEQKIAALELKAEAKAEKKAEKKANSRWAIIPLADGTTAFTFDVPMQGQVIIESDGSIVGEAPAIIKCDALAFQFMYGVRLALKSNGYKFNRETKEWVK